MGPPRDIKGGRRSLPYTSRGRGSRPTKAGLPERCGEPWGKGFANSTRGRDSRPTTGTRGRGCDGTIFNHREFPEAPAKRLPEAGVLSSFARPRSRR